MQAAGEQQGAQHAVKHHFRKIDALDQLGGSCGEFRHDAAGEQHQHREDQTDGGDADHVRQLQQPGIDVAEQRGERDQQADQLEQRRGGVHDESMIAGIR